MDLLLAAGVYVNEQRSSGIDLLSAAISRKNLNLIQRLLVAGAVVNKTNIITPGFEEEFFPVVTTILLEVVSFGGYLLI
jgi:ankyrin repeat protein